jgi:hypothetical protein
MGIYLKPLSVGKIINPIFWKENRKFTSDETIALRVDMAIRGIAVVSRRNPDPCPSPKLLHEWNP